MTFHRHTNNKTEFSTMNPQVEEIELAKPKQE